MITYSIKDLERISGIKAHTIRIWEKRYNLLSPSRSDTNIRSYTDNDLKKLLNTSILLSNGYKISRIAELSDTEIPALVNNISSNSKETNDLLQGLLIAMIDIDEAVFEKIMLKTMIQMGFEKMMNELMTPFFDRLSLLWQTNAVNPAQIHFFKSLVRQKLIVAIDGLVIHENEKTRTFLIFLPPKENCEIEMLYMNYLLRKKGHKVIYLGGCTPSDSIHTIIYIKPVDYIVTSINESMQKEEAECYIESLKGKLPNKTIFINTKLSGKFESLPQDIITAPSVNKLAENIESYLQ